MKQMRNIKKPLIKLGRVKVGNTFTPRLFLDSGLILRELSPRSQRVLVKVKQSYADSLGAWRGHGRYLERDKARSGSGFSAENNDAQISRELNKWQNTGDQKLHKIILSPEYAERIDLKEHTRKLMQQVEKDLGKELEWAAIIHKNTDNHHVHIVLRGVDALGNSLDIEDYLGKTLRERSQDLVTRKLGPRLYPEILEQRNKELESKRVTDIDRALLWKADKDNLITIPSRSASDWKREKSKTQERVRLEFLSRLGLAERVGSDSWQLSSDLRDHLRRLSLQEQLVREQVPGWEFVRTLSKSGVVRKTLTLGESLTGRVVAVDLRDPFGDKRYMLLEGIDGKTYHLNQARGIKIEKVQAGDVLTLERRALESLSNLSNTKIREFTAVRIHKNWEKSFIIDCEAVTILRQDSSSKESLLRVGFSKEWREASQARAGELKLQKFNPNSISWKDDLATLHFSEIDSKARSWNPREYFLRTASEQDKNSLIVGEVKASSDKKLLIADVRDGICRIVNLNDVGLDWPANVGAIVSVAAKVPPHTELRPSDSRIAQLLAEHKHFFEENLRGDERKFVAARANTWLKWKILEQDMDGSFRVSKDYKSKTKQEILQIMEAKLLEVRTTFREEARKQPAWLRQLKGDLERSDSLRFSRLDQILNSLGSIPEEAPKTLLSDALKNREKFWKERGVALDQSFEMNARQCLREENQKSKERELDNER